MDDNTKKLSIALLSAAANGHNDVVCKLIQKGANVNYIREGNETILMHAAQNGNLYAARLIVMEMMILLKKGIDDGVYTAPAGTTDMDYAQLLLKEKLNIQDDNGNTALIYASQNCHSGVVKFLMESGADSEIVNEFGVNALMYAAQKGRSDILDILSGEYLEDCACLFKIAGYSDEIH